MTTDHWKRDFSRVFELDLNSRDGVVVDADMHDLDARALDSPPWSVRSDGAGVVDSVARSAAVWPPSGRVATGLHEPALPAVLRRRHPEIDRPVRRFDRGHTARLAGDNWRKAVVQLVPRSGSECVELLPARIARGKRRLHGRRGRRALDQIQDATADAERRCDEERRRRCDYRNKRRSPPWPSRPPPDGEPVRVVDRIP